MNYKIKYLQKFTDKRGDLIVFLKESELSLEKKKLGQIYFITFKNKGIIRGNHYHKKWYEWFGVVTGKVEVFLKDIKTGEIKTFILDADSDRYKRLEVGPYIAHAFKSLTDNVSLLNYADSEWSKEDSIFYKLI
jgi:dTDP-4-dehydrorhamnose 3,5-epimerase